MSKMVVIYHRAKLLCKNFIGSIELGARRVMERFIMMMFVEERGLFASAVLS